MIVSVGWSVVFSIGSTNILKLFRGGSAARGGQLVHWYVAIVTIVGDDGTCRSFGRAFVAKKTLRDFVNDYCFCLT